MDFLYTMFYLQLSLIHRRKPTVGRTVGHNTGCFAEFIKMHDLIYRRPILYIDSYAVVSPSLIAKAFPSPVFVDTNTFLPFNTADIASGW